MNNGWNDKEPEEVVEKSNENLNQTGSTQDTYHKQEQKIMKQELKLGCLKLACGLPDCTPDEIVKTAQAFYNFARR